MRPWLNTATRSDSVIASAWSCVTKTMVTPSSRCRRRISSCISSRSFLSSADSGSSISTTRGSNTSAARQRHALLLAARQLLRRCAGQMAQPHLVQRGGHAGGGGGRVDLAHLQRKGHVLRHRHVREQRVALEHHAHVALVRRHRS
jgi:hypothetical protein